MFVFRKICRALFSWNARFEIRPFALLLTHYVVELDLFNGKRMKLSNLKYFMMPLMFTSHEMIFAVFNSLFINLSIFCSVWGLLSVVSYFPFDVIFSWIIIFKTHFITSSQKLFHNVPVTLVERFQCSVIFQIP